MQVTKHLQANDVAGHHALLLVQWEYLKKVQLTSSKNNFFSPHGNMSLFDLQVVEVHSNPAEEFHTWQLSRQINPPLSIPEISTLLHSTRI